MGDDEDEDERVMGAGIGLGGLSGTEYLTFLEGTTDSSRTIGSTSRSMTLSLKLSCDGLDDNSSMSNRSRRLESGISRPNVDEDPSRCFSRVPGRE